MTRPTHEGPAFDPDQAAALRRLRAAFAVGQVTVVLDVQLTSRSDQDSAPNKAPALVTLLEEGS